MIQLPQEVTILQVNDSTEQTRYIQQQDSTCISTILLESKSLVFISTYTFEQHTIMYVHTQQTQNNAPHDTLTHMKCVQQVHMYMCAYVHKLAPTMVLPNRY